MKELSKSEQTVLTLIFYLIEVLKEVSQVRIELADMRKSLDIHDQ